jgi:hypothetical protein
MDKEAVRIDDDAFGRVEQIKQLEEEVNKAYENGFHDGLIKALTILDAWKDEYGMRAIRTILAEKEKECTSSQT